MNAENRDTLGECDPAALSLGRTVSIVIPAFNEGRAIGVIVSRIRALFPEFEVIVIDDGSQDETGQKAAEAGAKVYRHPYNIGNGAAVKAGIRLAKGDIIVFMDGDGQHRPEDISTMLQYFPEYDMVVGARQGHQQTSYSRAFGNTVYNWLASYVANFAIKDLTSGFRAVKADIARSFLPLLPNSYSYPTTLTLGVLRSGRSLKYVPIDAQLRATGKSNIRIMHDGVRFFMIITKICTLYAPMRIFLPVSFSMFWLGMARYLYSYLTDGRFTNMSHLLFLGSIIIFMMSLISEQICQMRAERAEEHNSILGKTMTH